VEKACGCATGTGRIGFDSVIAAWATITELTLIAPPGIEKGLDFPSQFRRAGAYFVQLGSALELRAHSQSLLENGLGAVGRLIHGTNPRENCRCLPC
jgi:hypothetical protein